MSKSTETPWFVASAWSRGCVQDSGLALLFAGYPVLTMHGTVLHTEVKEGR